MAFRRHDEQPSATVNTDFTLSVARGRHEVRHAHSPIVLRMTMQPTPARFMTDERFLADKQISGRNGSPICDMRNTWRGQDPLPSVNHCGHQKKKRIGTTLCTVLKIISKDLMLQK
jgi:hypothetical protein